DQAVIRRTGGAFEQPDAVEADNGSRKSELLIGQHFVCVCDADAGWSSGWGQICIARLLKVSALDPQIAHGDCKILLRRDFYTEATLLCIGLDVTWRKENQGRVAASGCGGRAAGWKAGRVWWATQRIGVGRDCVCSGCTATKRFGH